MISSSNNVRPEIHLLSGEMVKRVHNYSIEILENIGIRVESKRVIELFAKSGGVRVDGDLVYIQGELVNHAIKIAKSEIGIHGKDGQHAFNLGKRYETRFGVGVTNINYQDIETDRLSKITREHTQRGTKLGDMLNNFDMISTIGIPSDVNTSRLDLYNALDLYANSSKPEVILVAEGRRMEDVLKLLSFLHGDISSRPFIIPYFNPITPLVLNKETTDKIFVTMDYNLPVAYSNYSMYGATSPITEGGTLALLNAELLAGLVFCQLVKEGAPVILGSLPAGFNMHTMGSYYSPSSYMLNLACAEMMVYYDIPHCGTSGSGNGYGPDLIAAGDLWINHLTSCIGKVGMAPFVGGNLDSTAFSPATVVMSDYIIGMARRFSKGFSLDDKSVNIEEMKTAGHGGNYLTSGQTLESMSTFSYSQDLWEAMSMHKWQEEGSPTPKKLLIDYTMDLYEKAGNAVLENRDLLARGEEYIESLDLL